MLDPLAESAPPALAPDDEPEAPEDELEEGGSVTGGSREGGQAGDLYFAVGGEGVS